MTKKLAIIFDFSGTLVKMRPASLLIRKQFLKNASKKYKLGIITGAKRTETINITTKLGLLKLFPAIITKDDTRLRKPNPKLLEMIERKLSAKIAVYVGDSKKDKLMAEAKGVPFIMVK